MESSATMKIKVTFELNRRRGDRKVNLNTYFFRFEKNSKNMMENFMYKYI